MSRTQLKPFYSSLAFISRGVSLAFLKSGRGVPEPGCRENKQLLCQCRKLPHLKYFQRRQEPETRFYRLFLQFRRSARFGVIIALSSSVADF